MSLNLGTEHFTKVVKLRKILPKYAMEQGFIPGEIVRALVNGMREDFSPAEAGTSLRIVDLGADLLFEMSLYINNLEIR